MKKILLVLAATLPLFSYAQEAFQPPGSTILESVDGDLDNDGIPEKVIIYTTKEVDIGNIREIQILKKVDGQWQLMEKSRKAVLDSRGGGMMGDPYGGMRIEKGILLIEQSGGSSWKWGYTDKYRFQHGRFELIGHTSVGGRAGDYVEIVDFNLSTGQLNYKKNVDDVEQHGPSVKESYVRKGVNITLQNRNQQEVKFVLPKTKAVIYLQ